MSDRGLVPASAPPPSDDPSTPARPGWYFDPAVSARRWWDGDTWTDLVETHVPISAAGRHSGDPGRHGVGLAPGRPFGEHGAFPVPTLVTPRRAAVVLGAAAAATAALVVVIPFLRSEPVSDAARPGPTGTPTAPATTSPGTASAPSSQAPAPSTSAPEPVDSAPEPGGTGGTSSDAVLLVDTSGTGPSVLPEFAVLGAWQLQYSFDCANVGAPAAFAVMSGPRALVTVRAASGQDVVDQTVEGIIKLSVATTCGWTVQVFGPPPQG